MSTAIPFGFSPRALTLALLGTGLVLASGCGSSGSSPSGGSGTSRAGSKSGSQAGLPGSAGGVQTAGKDGSVTAGAGLPGELAAGGTQGSETKGGIAGESAAGNPGSGGTQVGTPGAGGKSAAAGAAGSGKGGAGGTLGGAAGSGKGGAGGTPGGAGGSGKGGAGGAAGAGTAGAAACPTPALKSGDTNRNLTVGSDSRTYILHVPSAYAGSKAMPLVIDFHGITGNGSGEEGSSPYKAVTDAEGVVSAYPTGKAGPMGNAWNVGPCCVKDVDDVAFAKAIVADVSKVACIDPKRVYAVGFSMGGGMSHYLGCHAADTFAAVAPAAFDLLKENQDACTPSRPIPVILFRSTGDTVVPYAGGASNLVTGMPINFLGAKATQQKWASINGCSGAAPAEDSKGCSAYTTCKNGTEVVLCTKQGGSHEPGNASLGWPFLKRFTLP